VKGKKKLLLEELLEANINKVEKLNREIASFPQLKRGQYSDLVDKVGLKSVFQFDVFFAVKGTPFLRQQF
jgi:hypothetical protein